ncbi:MAG: hypothetical protein IIB15_05155 [Chloroflexi bacterium]|nr:hypothetical protein [Chloroflexota bacterium]
MSDETINKEVDERFNIVKRLYGDRLTSEELDEVRKGVEGIVEAAESLRAVKLENGDEPFSVFVPYRKED